MTHPAIEETARLASGMSENEWAQATDARKTYEIASAKNVIFTFLNAVAQTPPSEFFADDNSDAAWEKVTTQWCAVMAALAVDLGWKP